MRRSLLPGALVFATLPAWGGEIVFIDPAREKAQALQQKDAAPAPREPLHERVLDAARARSGGAAPSPRDVGEAPVSAAGERSREARAYLDDAPAAQPTVILRNAPPPTDAAKARQTARSWTPPATGKTASKAAGNNCATENTVGGIEGRTQGHTVIETGTSGVNALCK